MPSPSALWPDGHIVVEQAWPNKGRAYTTIRRQYEIVSAAPRPKNGSGRLRGSQCIEQMREIFRRPTLEAEFLAGGRMLETQY